jgi:tripartite-type tricarboxylate transporter receptor subunit TctC
MKLFRLALTLVLVPLCSIANAQSWPSRPITIVVTYPPGGTADMMARSISVPLGKLLSTTVIVENKPGATGQIAANYVAKSNPDGYTLMLDASSFAVNPSLFKKLPYDSNKDFKVLALLALYPNVLLTNPNFAPKSVKELVALAKTKPDEIAYATSGNGSAQHLAGVMFEIKADVQMVGVPYKGGAAALNDVMAGQVPIFFGSVASSKPYVEAKKLNALAVTSKKRVNLFPSVPTMEEAGVAAYEVYEWNAIFVPSGTSEVIVKKLSDAVAAVMQLPEMKERVISLGGEQFQGGPNDVNQFIQTQFQEWGKIIRDKKISLD